jgi:hypothetical protein
VFDEWGNEVWVASIQRKENTRLDSISQVEIVNALKQPLSINASSMNGVSIGVYRDLPTVVCNHIINACSYE